MLKIALIGASGKMGHHLINLIKHYPQEYSLVFAYVRDSGKISPLLQATAQKIGTNLNALPDQVDVVIDFSHTANIYNILEICTSRHISLIIGTTGFNFEQIGRINAASDKIAIVYAPNTGFAVNVLYKLSELAASYLTDFDTEIIETHHRHKKDAPSGTATKIGEAIANGKKIDFKTNAVYARHGISDKVRDSNAIGFAVVRGGDVIGKHEVLFLSDGQRLTISCEVTNRAVYAKGALMLAAKVIHQPAGVYDVLDLIYG